MEEIKDIDVVQTTSPSDRITVHGRRWDSVNVVSFETVEGKSLEELILCSIKKVYAHYEYTDTQYKNLLDYVRCKLNGVERHRSEWERIYPKNGSVIQIFHGVRGGGGDGGLMGIVQVVVGAIMTVVGVLTSWTGVGAIIGKIGIGLIVTGLLSTASALLFPVQTPEMGSLGSGSSSEPEKQSPAYSISGAKNRANVNGYVPLVLGRHRHYPPLGGRSWTSWEGDKQYFHMLVVWGFPEMQVSDFRIGDTPLGYYLNVAHVFHQSTTGNDLSYFSKSFQEQNVEAVLTYDESWNTRTVGEAQTISLDFAFLRGLVDIDKEKGDYRVRTVQIQAQYKVHGTSTWYGLGGSDGYHVFSGATSERTVRTISISGLPKAVYDVRCRRAIPEASSTYIKDECTWYTMRAIIDIPAFNTPIPICVSELRIRASEQLSGYVEDFNGICHSNVPDWNGATWETRLTRNPASLMRYVLTHRSCIAKPYASSKLDNTKLVEFWNYCNANGYCFDYICDSEKSLWERLIDITAPGRAAPTTDVDGKWGVVIDNNGKKPVQLFTPRNSWGMSIQREYAKLPDALRTSFVDETDGYVTKEGFIFNDGFSNTGSNRPQDVVEWSFPGITNWNRVYKQGRMYLARMLHRQMIINISTDWEWIICHRGDLVGVASDVLMNTFGVARISGLLYEENGMEVVVNSNEDLPSGVVPIGVRIDDSVLFDEPSPARYGIAIRKTDGSLYTYEIVPEYGEERDLLRFAYPISAAQIPQIGAIVSVSLLGEEYEEYLVAQISPQENMSAQIKLIPYKVTEIERAMSGAIPPYSETVVMDVVRGARLPTPYIIQLVSDESVLAGRTGASIPRIAAWWKRIRTTQDTNTLMVQLRATDVETGEMIYGTAQENGGVVYIQGVQEGRVYDVSLRMTNSTTGVASAWSPTIRHLCIGRTTPPPAPTQVFLDGTVLKITQGVRPQDVVGHVVYIVFDENDPIEYAKKLTDTYTSTGSFDIASWSGYARRIYVRAIDEIGLLSDPVSVVVDLMDREVNNVVFTIKETDRSWPGTIENGSFQHGNLTADDGSYLWSADGDSNLWNVSSFPMWSGAAKQMSYTYDLNVPVQYSGAGLRVKPQEIYGRLLSVEYRVAVDAPLWQFDGSQAIWDSDNSLTVWTEPFYGAWRVLPTDFVVNGGEQMQIKVTYSGGEAPAVLSDIWTVFDVPDLEWAVEDMEVSIDGTAVPIPQNYFRAITNVIATLQYREGDIGVTATYIPSSAVLGGGGFLLTGPILRVLDASRNATVGNLDVRLKGY